MRSRNYVLALYRIATAGILLTNPSNILLDTVSSVDVLFSLTQALIFDAIESIGYLDFNVNIQDTYLFESAAHMCSIFANGTALRLGDMSSLSVAYEYLYRLEEIYLSASNSNTLGGEILLQCLDALNTLAAVGGAEEASGTGRRLQSYGGVTDLGTAIDLIDNFRLSMIIGEEKSAALSSFQYFISSGRPLELQHLGLFSDFLGASATVTSNFSAVVDVVDVSDIGRYDVAVVSLSDSSITPVCDIESAVCDLIGLSSISSSALILSSPTQLSALTQNAVNVWSKYLHATISTNSTDEVHSFKVFCKGDVDEMKIYNCTEEATAGPSSVLEMPCNAGDPGVWEGSCPLYHHAPACIDNTVEQTSSCSVVEYATTYTTCSCSSIASETLANSEYEYKFTAVSAGVVFTRVIHTPLFLQFNPSLTVPSPPTPAPSTSEDAEVLAQSSPLLLNLI